jgi:VanZ family protein
MVKSMLLWGYISTLFLIAVLPLNGSSEFALNHNFVLSIRLDHLLHSVIFIPWILIGRTCKNLSFAFLLTFGILLATLTEGIQYFLPYRSFNINDMVSNILGVLIGLIVLFFKGMYKPEYKK